jgi:peptide/nickel transport system substrate-binding protein
MNPFYASANADIEAQNPSFPTLVKIDGDLAYYPELASELPTIDNGDVVVNGTKIDVTWKLKPGMKWSDGQPITCADLEGTWKWVVDKDNVGVNTTGWSDITAIDGGTDTTCVVHYGKFYSAYLLQFGTVFPAHYISKIPVKDAPTKLYPLKDPTSAVYGGCYIPKSIDPSSQITYVPNPNCATIYGHPPYLDGLIFKYYGDSPSMIAGFRSGENDVSIDLSDADIPNLSDIPQNQLLVQDALFSEAFFFNNKRIKANYGDDYKTIIRAMMTATDISAIIKGPMNGTVTQANNFLSPKLWFYKDEPFTVNFDLDKAKGMLDAAGWVPGSDGIRAKGGKKLAMEICTTTRPYRVAATTLLASQLKALGVDGTPKAKPANPDVFGSWNDVPPDTDCNVEHGNYDIAMHGNTSSPDPTSFASLFKSGPTGDPDSPQHPPASNEMRWFLPEMDAAWKTIETSLDPAAIKDAMGTVLDLIASDQNTGYLPLFNHRNVWLVGANVHNVVADPSVGAQDWNTEDWWLSK